MITYVTAAGQVRPEQAEGFFEGWPNPPTSATLVRVMDAAHRRVWALDGDRAVGYVNAISDGVLTAFIPWLEVLPGHRRQGIGSELVRRVVAQLDGMYSIDLCCDPGLVAFYEKLGMWPLSGAGLRRPENLS